MSLLKGTLEKDGAFTVPLSAGSLPTIPGRSDAGGAFAFAGLEPGSYVLSAQVRAGGLGATLSDASGKSVIITVGAGQTVDLGQITIK
jgi:hypothetical protein